MKKIRQMTKRDCYFGTLAGFFIGLILLPVIRTARPEIYNSKLALSLIVFFTIATPLGLWVANLISRKIAVVWQVAKFGVTGVLNFLIDLGVLSVLILALESYIHIEAKTSILTLGFFVLTYYSLCKATSFIIANINSYVWNKYWTFEKKSTEKSASEFTQFFIVSIIGFVINVFVASYIFKSLSPIGVSSSQWALVGAAAGSIAGLVWNFIGYKFIVFKK